MAAPIRISYTETASWVTNGAPAKSIASISWQIGDVLVAKALGEDADTGNFNFALPTNTGTGLIWINKQTSSGLGLSAARIDIAIATANDSGVITQTPTDGGDARHWGFCVEVWRGSSGVGNSVEQHTTAKTVSLTAAGGAHSAFSWAMSDFSADAAFTAGTPTPTNTTQNAQDAGKYTFAAFSLTDQASAGAVSYGATGGGTTGPFSIVAIEIKASVAADVAIGPATGSLAEIGRAPAIGLGFGIPAPSLTLSGQTATAAVLQYARPTSDVSAGSWTPSTGVTLAGVLDENDPDDADYIRSAASPVADTAIVALAALQTPGAGTVTLRVRARHV